MKKILAVVLAFSMLFIFASCGKKPDTNNDLKKITLALDWTPNTNHTGLYVAREKGYFEAAGLDVNIVFIDGDSTARLCAVGSAQFAFEAQDTLAAAFATEEPLAVTAIAAVLQHNTSGIISRKGEGMTSAKGLEGKTYSTWDLPVELAILRSLVEKEGGNFDKVNLIPNTVTDEPGALAAGQTDAIWVFYGWGGINAEVQGLDFDWFFFKDLDSVFDYYTPIIIGNNEFMQNEPDTTRAFLAAVKKGYEFAAQNPEEAADILIASDNTGSLKGSEELVKKSQVWLSGEYIADSESWGVIDPERWDRFYAWLYENGLIEKELPAGTGFTDEYLK